MWCGIGVLGWDVGCWKSYAVVVLDSLGYERGD
jgi:hypothetical protein